MKADSVIIKFRHKMWFFLLCLLIIEHHTLIAQWKDTTSLQSVDVIAIKKFYGQAGKKVDIFDSSITKYFKTQSVADILSIASPVFIKNYGPGGLNTTAFRGGNASQTAILWNGFNINNGMLGQTDLGIINSFLFDRLELVYGASSSAWGSGSMSGGLHLNNDIPLNKGLRTELGLIGNTISNKNLLSSIAYSKEKFGFTIKGTLSDCGNTYSYLDNYSNNVKKFQNAAYNNSNLISEFKLISGKRSFIKVNAWMLQNKRNLPNYGQGSTTFATQSDRTNRFTANWFGSFSKLNSTVRAGYFNDKIQYDDSLSKTHSLGIFENYLIESDNAYQYRANASFYLNVSGNHVSAVSNNYNKTKYLNNLTFIIGHRSYFFNERLSTNIIGRYENSSLGYHPFTFQTGTDFALTKSTRLKLNGGTVYRIPTLHDLFWVPGGNAKLKPESGYHMDGGMEYATGNSKYELNFTGNIYNKVIDNWILWLPGNNGTSTPMNIQKVWSRGSETRTSLQMNFGSLKFKPMFVSGYNLSTVKSSNLENSESLNKQLIYTPRYTYNGIFEVIYKRTSIAYTHQYIGYRFTSSDNSSWLKPYHVSGIKFYTRMPFKSFTASITATAFNLFNADYMVIQNRPMPRRYFETGILINYN